MSGDAGRLAERADLRRLAHDLRGPLNSVIGFAELLRDGKAGPVSPLQQELLGDIMQSGRQVLRLIDETLAPETVCPAPRPEPTAPGDGPDAAPGGSR